MKPRRYRVELNGKSYEGPLEHLHRNVLLRQLDPLTPCRWDGRSYLVGDPLVAIVEPMPTGRKPCGAADAARLTGGGAGLAGPPSTPPNAGANRPRLGATDGPRQMGCTLGLPSPDRLVPTDGPGCRRGRR